MQEQKGGGGLGNGNLSDVPTTPPINAEPQKLRLDLQTIAQQTFIQTKNSLVNTPTEITHIPGQYIAINSVNPNQPLIYPQSLQQQNFSQLQNVQPPQPYTQSQIPNQVLQQQQFLQQFILQNRAAPTLQAPHLPHQNFNQVQPNVLQQQVMQQHSSQANQPNIPLQQQPPNLQQQQKKLSQQNQIQHKPIQLPVTNSHVQNVQIQSHPHVHNQQTKSQQPVQIQQVTSQPQLQNQQVHNQQPVQNQQTFQNQQQIQKIQVQNQQPNPVQQQIQNQPQSQNPVQQQPPPVSRPQQPQSQQQQTNQQHIVVTQQPQTSYSSSESMCQILYIFCFDKYILTASPFNFSSSSNSFFIKLFNTNIFVLIHEIMWHILKMCIPNYKLLYMLSPLYVYSLYTNIYIINFKFQTPLCLFLCQMRSLFHLPLLIHNYYLL